MLWGVRVEGGGTDYEKKFTFTNHESGERDETDV